MTIEKHRRKYLRKRVDDFISDPNRSSLKETRADKLQNSILDRGDPGEEDEGLLPNTDRLDCMDCVARSIDTDN